MEELQEYKKRIATTAAKARWANKTDKQKSEIMKEVRRKGILNKKLKEDNN